jgi:hypothetical protein
VTTSLAPNEMKLSQTFQTNPKEQTKNEKNFKKVKNFKLNYILKKKLLFIG